MGMMMIIMILVGTTVFHVMLVESSDSFEKYKVYIVHMDLRKNFHGALQTLES